MLAPPAGQPVVIIEPGQILADRRPSKPPELVLRMGVIALALSEASPGRLPRISSRASLEPTGAMDRLTVIKTSSGCSRSFLPLRPGAMKPEELRIALFSGNYNYVRDGANQALNRLVGFLLRQGAQVRVYSPTWSIRPFRRLANWSACHRSRFPPKF